MGPLDPLSNSDGGKTLIQDDVDENHRAASDVGSELSPVTNGSAGTSMENDSSKRRKSSVLPLEVRTHVMCRWKGWEVPSTKVIEHRKISSDEPNDYEYYVHYTECLVIVINGYLMVEFFSVKARGLVFGCIFSAFDVAYIFVIVYLVLRSITFLYQFSST